MHFTLSGYNTILQQAGLKTILLITYQTVKRVFAYFDQDATLHKNTQTTNFQLYILDIKHNIPDFWRRTMLELYSLDGFKFTLPPGREHGEAVNCELRTRCVSSHLTHWPGPHVVFIELINT